MDTAFIAKLSQTLLLVFMTRLILSSVKRFLRGTTRDLLYTHELKYIYGIGLSVSLYYEFVVGYSIDNMPCNRHVLMHSNTSDSCICGLLKYHVRNALINRKTSTRPCMNV